MSVEEELVAIDNRAQAACEFALGRIAEPCEATFAARQDTYNLVRALRLCLAKFKEVERLSDHPMSVYNFTFDHSRELIEGLLRGEPVKA